MVALTSFDDLINPRLHGKFEPKPVYAALSKDSATNAGLEIDENRNPVVIVNNHQPSTCTEAAG